MKRMMCFGLFVALLLVPVAAQEKLNSDINAKIRQEESSHSQIMRTLHFLTDVYGPRMTGTPSLKAAGEWAVQTMESWGFTNGRLEPWDFGHPGWVALHEDGDAGAPRPHFVGAMTGEHCAIHTKNPLMCFSHRAP